MSVSAVRLCANLKALLTGSARVRRCILLLAYIN